MTEVHQVLPVYSEGDAIGSHARNLRRVLLDAGYRSEIYAGAVVGRPGPAQPLEAYRTGPGDRVVIHHASTASDVNAWVTELGDPVLVDYHNITPPEFFRRWSPAAARAMTRARLQLVRLAAAATFGIADSEYNRLELEALGVADSAVVPILMDLRDFDADPDRKTLGHLRRRGHERGAEWLFVGRVAPNKCQHDVIAAFSTYRATVDPAAQLTLVGGATVPAYWRALERMVTDLGLTGSVHLADNVSFPKLLAHYHAADVFVCLSEHEGFCVPVVEAMHLQKPVVAFAAGAVPDTVGDAAVVLPDKHPAVVADAVARVLSRPELRRTLIDRGRARAAELDLSRTAAVAAERIAHALETIRG